MTLSMPKNRAPQGYIKEWKYVQSQGLCILYRSASVILIQNPAKYQITEIEFVRWYSINSINTTICVFVIEWYNNDTLLVVTIKSPKRASYNVKSQTIFNIHCVFLKLHNLACLLLSLDYSHMYLILFVMIKEDVFLRTIIYLRI